MSEESWWEGLAGGTHRAGGSVEKNSTGVYMTECLVLLSKLIFLLCFKVFFFKFYVVYACVQVYTCVCIVVGVRCLLLLSILFISVSVVCVLHVCDCVFYVLSVWVCEDQEQLHGIHPLLSLCGLWLSKSGVRACLLILPALIPPLFFLIRALTEIWGSAF